MYGKYIYRKKQLKEDNLLLCDKEPDEEEISSNNNDPKGNGKYNLQWVYFTTFLVLIYLYNTFSNCLFLFNYLTLLFW